MSGTPPLKVVVVYAGKEDPRGAISVGVVSENEAGVLCGRSLEWSWNVPEKDLPDTIIKAKRWAARANRYGLPNSHIPDDCEAV